MVWMTNFAGSLNPGVIRASPVGHQIKNRLTECLAAEVRALEAEDGASPR